MPRSAQDGRLFSAPDFEGFGPSRFHPDGGAPGGFSIRGRGARLRQGMLDNAPRRPGVYAMLDARHRIIYVGKAKCLRTRLACYFRPDSREPKAGRIIQQTRTLLWEHAPHELGALLRELELIQRHRPRYNVLGLPGLRRYCYIALNRPHAPGLSVIREPGRRDQTVFGPFIRRYKVEAAVRRINDFFQLRDCPATMPLHFADDRKLFDTDPAAKCLRFELGTCLGPCGGGCTRREYADAAARARHFLDGTNRALLGSIRTRMLEAAARQEYELARACRDKLADLEWLDLRLALLRRSRRESAFVYPVTAVDGREFWFLLNRGRVWGAAWAPLTAEERARVAELLTTMLSERSAAPVTTTSVDSVLLLAEWFRRHNHERSRLEPAERVLARLQSPSAAA